MTVADLTHNARLAIEGSLDAEVVLYTDEHTEDEWLEARQSGLGGSDMAAILGLSTYTDSFSLWALKTGRVAPEPSNTAQRRGKHLEDGVREWYAEEEDVTVIKADVLLRSIDHPVLLASPDAWELPRSIYEGKVAHGSKIDEWKAGPPPAYEVQCRHYLAVTGLERAVLVGMVGTGLQKWVVERDEKIERNLIRAAEKWWAKHVVGDEAPPVGGLLSSDTVGRMWTGIDPDDAVEGGDELAALLRDCKVAAENVHNADDAKAAADNRLRLFLGECGYGLVHGDVAVTWKESHPRRIDTKRLRAENPEYAELYTTTKPSRTLLRKGEYA